MRMALCDQTVVGECCALCDVMAPQKEAHNPRLEHGVFPAWIRARCLACTAQWRCVISPKEAYKQEVLKPSTCWTASIFSMQTN